MCGRLVCKKSAQTEKFQAQKSNMRPANSPYPGSYITQKRVTAEMCPRGVHPGVISFMGASGLKTEKD